MAEIVWTARARQDLLEIVRFISRDSKAYAESFALRLRKSVDRLSIFPESGRFVPEDPEKRYREVLVGNYRVLYTLRTGQVVIMTVIHGARRLEP